MATTTPTTITVESHHRAIGEATLTTIEEDGYTVLQVTPDAALAGYYGTHQHTGQVIGSLVHHRGRWAVTAYADRDHLLNNTGPAYYLPYARSRAEGVRMLLKWWWIVARATKDEAPHLNPFECLTAKERKLLAA